MSSHTSEGVPGEDAQTSSVGPQGQMQDTNGWKSHFFSHTRKNVLMKAVIFLQAVIRTEAGRVHCKGDSCTQERTRLW